MSKYGNEKVLVADRKFLSFNVVRPDGLCVGYYSAYVLLQSKTCDDCNMRFMLRDDAEDDKTVKQIISYVIITDGGRFLSYTRGKKCDARLAAKISIGFGGHVNPMHDVPQSFQSLLSANLHRELHEELILPDTYTLNIVGIINDDSNEVGERHLGLVYWMRVSDLECIGINAAAEICNLSILNTESDAPVDRMESWSQLCWVNRVSLCAENEFACLRQL